LYFQLISGDISKVVYIVDKKMLCIPRHTFYLWCPVTPAIKITGGFDVL